MCVLVALVWNNAQPPVLPDLLAFFEALAKGCAVAYHHQHSFCYLPPIDVVLAQRGFPAENIVLFCVSICTELLGFLTAQTCGTKRLSKILYLMTFNFEAEHKT